MRHKNLLLTGMLPLWLLSANAADVQFGFEGSDTKTPTACWGIESDETVDNPYKCGNTTDKCEKVVISGYGGNNYWIDGDWSSNLIAVDVFAYSDETVKGYNATADQNIFLSVKAKKWTTLYYDFRSYFTSSSTGDNILIGGLSSGAGTIYIDNIRMVSAEEAAYDCEPMGVDMEVEYKYGRLAIGGGGFVSGLLFDKNTGVKLARTDVGGAYKWDATNCEWKQLFNFVSQANVGLLGVEAFAIDPTNGNNMYFLCGCQYFSGQKTSVLYTNDGGETFKETELTGTPFFVHGNGEGRNNGERIAVDPNNPNIIIAGSRVGTPLVISKDGGKTFSALSSFPSVYTSSVSWPSWESTKYNTTENSNGISAVVFDGNSTLADGSTARIYVGVSRTGSSNVYVTEDGGETWSPVAALPTSYMPLRMKMAQDGKLYIAYADKCVGGSSGAIYTYDHETGSATNISPVSSGYSFGDVEVSPYNSKMLIVSTNNTWVPQKWDNGSSANGDKFWVSSDGGKTWTELYQNFTITNNGVTWIPGYAIHWCGSMCFDPDNESKVSFASGNGIFSCLNPWGNNPTFYFDVNGVEETVALDLVSVPGGNPMSVIGDYTGFTHEKVNEFAPIHDPAPGTSSGIAYAAKNPDIMARVSGNEWADLTDYYTEDGGKTWTSFGKSSYQKVAFNADGSVMIVAQNGGGLKYSTDKGSSFSDCSGASSATFAVGDPVNSSYVYAAAKDAILVSSDGGKTFTSKTLTNDSYTRLCVVPGIEGLVYAPCGGSGLYVSTDKGSTFTKVDGLNACQAIGEGISEDGQSYYLYAWGTSDIHTGLFRSTDKGATWKIINDSKNQFGGIGNGQFVIGDNNIAGRFYMSTVGMGIVYGDLASNFESSNWKCYTEEGTAIEEAAANGNADDEIRAVSPNPFSATFSINESGEYEVYNAVGSLIEKGKYNAGQDMGSTWSTGLYLVKINGNTYKVSKR